ncbi:MAG: FtsQ-type POTRA domain-containing protein [Candidatus Marinimicrobia bacterium]|nr:FtsQ-type POTRA domain-containing protein [Candidatus Neomarinimicrobiota bacterium]MDD5582729.1 FtsQ-type POTRA domain-containing protein [Candidatus Neomarinimicrobiota bacterium]
MTYKNKKNLRIPSLILITGLILLMMASILYAKYQNIFNLNKIIVTGNYELTEEEIIYLSGVLLGEDILSLSITDISARLEKEPYIRQAVVYKRLPDRLVIEIHERTPILLMKIKESYSVDTQGILLPAPRSKGDIPLLTGIPSLITTDFGNPVHNPLILQGVGIISLIRKKYPKINLLIHDLSWDEKEKTWILISETGYPKIYLGNADLKKKIHILHAFIEQKDLSPSKIQAYEKIDLRYDKQVIVKPKG